MEYKEKRKKMVESQLIPRGISDPRVLEAFRKVPRDVFVPSSDKNESYADYPLPIGEGQTISQPYIVALMTQLLNLKKDSKVLEIGTGSGYQAAILAELSDNVYTVERNEVLCERARVTLAKLGYRNVKFRTGDGTSGWEEEAPFDAILVTAAPPDIPEPLKKQLAEGGILVVPVGPAFGQVLVRLTREKSGYKTESICGCAFVPLIGEYGWSEDRPKY